MAATVQINETNGADPGSETPNITNSNYGSVDAVNLDAAANPLTPDSASFEKWQQYEVTAMGGSAKVFQLKFFSTSPAADTTHHFNGHEVQATYDASKKTVYETPGTGTTKTPNAVPTSAPADPNIGIGGSLTGELTTTGKSDFIVSQVRAAAEAVAGTTLTNSYRYSEVA